jgi:hypothetical protein
VSSDTDLVAFLTARLDELEHGADAKLVHSSACDAVRLVAELRGPCDCFLPALIKADAMAKRQLIDVLFKHAAQIDGEWGCCHSADEIKAGKCDTPDLTDGLALLAAPFAEHPDYRPEWAPP